MNSLLQLASMFGPILQSQRFPVLEEELGPLSGGLRRLVRALVLLELDGFVSTRRGPGRPAHDRVKIARAFLAKAVFNLPNTRALLDRLRADAALRRLCGWEATAHAPDETAFSRSLSEFVRSEFPQRVHAALIERTQGQRLVGHIMRDSTAIAGRERPVAKPKPAAPAVRRPHRKSGAAKPPEQMTRLERQCSGARSVEQMLAELPRACDVGSKTNSKGRKSSWIGYKLHLDAASGQIPISCALISASVNDTQAAVPLAEMTARRVTSLYDLMDSGYDAEAIRQHRLRLGHVPLITPRKHDSQKRELAPHERRRLKERNAVERIFGRLKDEFGGACVRVRGWAKVMAHLMFGILALTADQLLRLAEPAAAEA